MQKSDQKSNLVVSGFLEYLTDTGMGDMVGQVREELDREVDKSKKADKIIVKSAVSLTSVQKKKLRDFVKNKIGANLPLINTLDKTILGGITINIGDWYIDASLRQGLTTLTQTLLL